MSNSIDTNALLIQLRSMARDAGIPATADNARLIGDSGRSEAIGSGKPAQVEFSRLLDESLKSVNARQAEAQQLVRSFEAGTPGVELSDVMVAMQKARISFEALTQVRNKMVTAYQDIMNMPL